MPELRKSNVELDHVYHLLRVAMVEGTYLVQRARILSFLQQRFV